MKKDAKYMIMLGMFAKTTPEYADKRKNDAAALIDNVNITEGDYLVVNAGPYDKATAENNLAVLAENGLEGYIYAAKKEKEQNEAPEEPKEASEIKQQEN